MNGDGTRVWCDAHTRALSEPKYVGNRAYLLVERVLECEGTGSNDSRVRHESEETFRAFCSYCVYPV